MNIQTDFHTKNQFTHSPMKTICSRRLHTIQPAGPALLARTCLVVKVEETQRAFLGLSKLYTVTSRQTKPTVERKRKASQSVFYFILSCERSSIKVRTEGLETDG